MIQHVYLNQYKARYVQTKHTSPVYNSNIYLLTPLLCSPTVYH